MAGNTFGTQFRLTTFGESHGNVIGGVIDGCPAGLAIDYEFILHEMQRRRPGQNDKVSARNEPDVPEFISGIFEGKTTGTPIAFLIPNCDVQSDDYENMKELFRPSHADYTWYAKYGSRDYRGSGRASARETVARVTGGAIAKLLLNKSSVLIKAFVSQIGDIQLDMPYHTDWLFSDAANPVCCPDAEKAREMMALLDRIKAEGDTVGGKITCVVMGVPVGWGEPVFDRLQADLAKAMLCIPAVKGFEYGSGFAAAAMKGSEHNDAWTYYRDGIHTLTNNSGGIQGGISNGEDIYFNVAFKPVATLGQAVEAIDRTGKIYQLQAGGRHDVCPVPRAVPVVEAMAALVLADHYLRAGNSAI
ncbi:MAG: chorismate synthase [Lentimicrobiaceae bacterium]|jgi:chorismate synthase|nr:chorismate synthase [Lentimicrobiaceae bacterium]